MSLLILENEPYRGGDASNILLESSKDFTEAVQNFVSSRSVSEKHIRGAVIPITDCLTLRIDPLGHKEKRSDLLSIQYVCKTSEPENTWNRYTVDAIDGGVPFVYASLKQLVGKRNTTNGYITDPEVQCEVFNNIAEMIRNNTTQKKSKK